MRRAIVVLVAALALSAPQSLVPSDPTVYWSCGAWQPAPLPVVAPGAPLPLLSDPCAE